MKKTFQICFIFVLTIDTFYTQTTWYQLNSTTTNDLYSVYFVNTSTGFASGYSGIIIKTTNGGLNWIQLNTNTSIYLYVLCFFDVNTGISAGSTGYMIRTTNSGTNWVFVSSSAYNILRNYSKIDSVTAYVSGSAATVIKTTNAGLNWNLLYVTSNQTYFSICFLNELTGFAGSYFMIFKTTNGGSVWEHISSLSENWYSAIHFVDLNTGFLGPGLYKTTNGGYNWTSTNIGSSTIAFTSHEVGFSAGYNYIYKTTNCGNSWIATTGNLNTGFNKIFFVDQNTGYAVGNGGKIYKTTNGGITGIAETNSSTPDEYKLFQNYPNPFNPGTNIKFSIPLLRGVSEGRGVLVRLVIYDILGREIAVLVNEQLKPGTYEVVWNASDYPSGVYFYQLITQEYFETKKMVLVK